MATNINTFKLFVEFCSNKIQVGGTVSPSQFNLLANQAQLQKFERDRAFFMQSGVTSEFLKTFFKNLTTGVSTTGTLTYPSDFVQTASVRHYYIPPTGSGIEVPVMEVTNKEYGKVAASQLMIPSKEFPKFSEFSTEYRFLPRDIGIVMVDYWRLPVVPVWGYTVSSNRPVYSAAASTNFEWTENFMNEIAGIYLSLIGVNLKDGELSAFSEMFKQQNNSQL